MRSPSLTEQQEERDKRAREDGSRGARPQRARVLADKRLCYRLRPRSDTIGEGLGFTRL